MQWLWLLLLLIIILTALVIGMSKVTKRSEKLIVSAGSETMQQSAFTHRAPVIQDASSPGVIEYSDYLLGARKLRIGRYTDWKSNRQIQTIAKYGNSNAFADLCKLLLKHVPNKQRLSMINMFHNRTDNQIYEAIGRYVNRNESGRSEGQATELCRTLSAYLKSSGVDVHELGVSSYLDIGGGDGGITQHVAEFVGATDVHCVEVKDAPADTHIKYSKPDAGKLPYPDASFDLITAIMSLHHIQELDVMVSEIHRVLKPGGYLFIKEHDCWNEFDAMLVDIEHCFFIHVLEHQETASMDHVVEHYKNYVGWDATLAPLQYIHGNYYYTNVRNTPSATRAYTCLYQKV